MVTAATATTRRRSRKRIGTVTPKEFCRALWEKRRVLAGPSTPLGVQTLQLGILLTHFIRANPDPFEFEEQLEQISADDRPRRVMLRQAAKGSLRTWRAQRWDRTDDGTLVIVDQPGRRG
jgi:hypothetical protein